MVGDVITSIDGRPIANAGRGRRCGRRAGAGSVGDARDRTARRADDDHRDAGKQDRGIAMSFGAPAALLGLAAIPLLAAWYVAPAARASAPAGGVRDGAARSPRSRRTAPAGAATRRCSRSSPRSRCSSSRSPTRARRTPRRCRTRRSSSRATSAARWARPTSRRRACRRSQRAARRFLDAVPGAGQGRRDALRPGADRARGPDDRPRRRPPGAARLAPHGGTAIGSAIDVGAGRARALRRAAARSRARPRSSCCSPTAARRAASTRLPRPGPRLAATSRSTPSRSGRRAARSP